MCRALHRKAIPQAVFTPPVTGVMRPMLTEAGQSMDFYRVCISAKAEQFYIPSDNNGEDCTD